MTYIDLRCGDSYFVLLDFPDNTFDSVVCDPPYGLSFMGKRWDYDVPNKHMWAEVLRVLKPGGYLLSFAGTRTQHRMAVNIEDAGFEIRDMIAWVYGSGMPKHKSCLKPALEPITMARKPAPKASLLNIEGCRTGNEAVESGRAGRTSDQFSKTAYANGNGYAGRNTESGVSIGRYPSNLIHDGSDEVVSLFPDSIGSGGSVPNVKISGYGDKNVGTGKSEYFGGERTKVDSGSGSAARFFYCAKTSKKDRGEDNNHPTVKPTDLMRYLCRLVTPPGGTVLDPFMGSGSTGKAAVLEGFNFVGIDLDPAYVEIAKKRIGAVNEAPS